MSNEMKRGLIHLNGTNPVEVVEEESEIDIPSEKRLEIDNLAECFKAYLDRAKDLLSDRFAHLSEFAPSYLAERGNVIVMRCIGGVIVRYEPSTDDPKMLMGYVDEPLGNACSILSQKLIVVEGEDYLPELKPDGMELTLSVTDSTGTPKDEISRLRVVFAVQKTAEIDPRLVKPTASARNQLSILIEGRMESVEDRTQSTPFLTKNTFRLSAGWECIEVYHSEVVTDWEPKGFEARAEIDILSSVTARQFENTELMSLDPHGHARKEYAALLNEFRALLDSNPEREELLQQFLKEHPELISPNHIRIWPKLSFGRNISDFVFREATGDYLLVELERSTHELFRKDGHRTDALDVALGQITDWTRYIEDNLRTVQDELGLETISVSPKAMIVIGRSSTLDSELRRKLTTIENQIPKLKILTFDDLYDSTKAVVENLLGPLWDPGGDTQVFYPNSRSLPNIEREDS